MSGGKPPSKNVKTLFFEKYLPALVFVLAGYFIADITILTFRDLMLPTQPPPARPQSFNNQQMNSRGAYNTITSRNIFSSDGVIPDPLRADGTAGPGEKEVPVASSLPLVLKGTIVHSNPQKSIASVEAKSKVIAYTVGDDIESLATLMEVQRGKIIIRNLNNSRLEFIEVKTDASKVIFGGAKPTVPTSGPSDVVQVAPNKFELKRSDLQKYTKDLGSILQQAASIPVRDGSGQITGFKLLSVQPGSIFTQLGVGSGDIIKSVNGEPIDSPAKAMELYQMLQNASSITLGYERDGSTIENVYNIK